MTTEVDPSPGPMPPLPSAHKARRPFALRVHRPENERVAFVTSGCVIQHRETFTSARVTADCWVDPRWFQTAEHRGSTQQSAQALQSHSFPLNSQEFSPRPQPTPHSEKPQPPRKCGNCGFSLTRGTPSEVPAYVTSRRSSGPRRSSGCRAGGFPSALPWSGGRTCPWP
jgi:hypothetical protein